MSFKRWTCAALLLAAAAGGLGWAAVRAGKRPEPTAQAEAPRRLRRSLLGLLFQRGMDRRLLAEGYRAVCVPVGDYALADLRPGDRVDVLSVFEALTSESRKEKLSATLLQNVRVLAVRRARDPKGRGTLQLMLNPREAQLAVLGVHQGEIEVVLRKEGDSAVYPMEMTSYRALFM